MLDLEALSLFCCWLIFWHLDCPSECSICFLACSCHSTCQSYVGDCSSFCSICPSVCCSFSVGAICLSFFQDCFFDLLSLLFLSIWHSSMATMGLAFPRDSVFCVANWSIREELRNHSRWKRPQGISFSIILSGGFLGGWTPRGPDPDPMSQSFLSGVTHDLHSPMKLNKSFFYLGGTL